MAPCLSLDGMCHLWSHASDHDPTMQHAVSSSPSQPLGRWMSRKVKMRRQVRTLATTSGKTHSPNCSMSGTNDENQKPKQVVEMVMSPHSARDVV